MTEKALEMMRQALKIRIKFIGHGSLQAAAVKEEIGKLLLIKQEYEESFQHIQQSYHDRLKIYERQNRIKNASAGRKTEAGRDLDRL